MLSNKLQELVYSKIAHSGQDNRGQTVTQQYVYVIRNVAQDLPDGESCLNIILGDFLKVCFGHRVFTVKGADCMNMVKICKFSSRLYQAKEQTFL